MFAAQRVRGTFSNFTVRVASGVDEQSHIALVTHLPEQTDRPRTHRGFRAQNCFPQGGSRRVPDGAQRPFRKNMSLLRWMGQSRAQQVRNRPRVAGLLEGPTGRDRPLIVFVIERLDKRRKQPFEVASLRGAFRQRADGWPPNVPLGIVGKFEKRRDTRGMAG